jgi:hypothetical protein
MAGQEKRPHVLGAKGFEDWIGKTPAEIKEMREKEDKKDKVNKEKA